MPDTFKAALHDIRVRNSDTLLSLVICDRQGLLAGEAVKDPAEQQWPGACLLLHTSQFVRLHKEGVSQADDALYLPCQT